MKNLLAGLCLVAIGATLGIIVWEFWPPTGPELQVSFDDRDGLAEGDPVYLDGFEIGSVRRIELEQGRTMVTVRLREEYAGHLTEDTTFIIESSGLINKEHRLEAHVLDDGAPPFREGHIFEGVGSALELAILEGSRHAARLIEHAAQSDWVKQAAKTAADLQRQVEAIDWKEIGDDLEQNWVEIQRELEALARSTEDEAREGYARVKPKIEELLGGLKERGKSEEADELREQLDDLWNAE